MLTYRIFYRNLCRLPKVSHFHRASRMESKRMGISLAHVVAKLESFAPSSLAEKWDNVGLLIEPYTDRTIRTVFLTNDLTMNVMKEAIRKDADLIISYHPIIFPSLTRITQSNWKEKIVSMCLAKGIGVYTPHTAWDCVHGGVNDWLADALPVLESEPIKVDPVTLCGPGRLVRMRNTFSIAKVIEDIQQHIGKPLHLAIGVDQTMDTCVETVAICVGSGASVLKNVDAGVYVTGEMSHHEILDAQHRNITVILCNHSNSERGYLNHFKLKLCDKLGSSCRIIVSECDKDPLLTVMP